MSLGTGGVWFPTIRAGTGVDKFTERLACGLRMRGVCAEITWLPHRAEYLPWSVPVPEPPKWASVVHVNSWLHRNFFPRHLPCVVTFHSCVHDSGFEPYKNILQKMYHNKWVYQRELEAIDRAEIVTAVSDYTANEAKKVFGVSEITTIHNWVDSELFCPSNKEITKDRKFKLLFVGNVNMRKGKDILVSVMRELGSNFELSYTDDPRSFSSNGNLPDNMISLGKIDSPELLVDIYRDHDALIFPSRLEGLPLSVLEAAATGLPVIASNSSSLPEVVKHEVTGLLCAQDMVKDFVNAARRLSSDKRLLNELSRNSVRWARSEFSYDIALDRYIEVYRQACKACGT